MSRWARWLLTASMALWTALTAGAGWWAFHGPEPPRPIEAAVVYNVASPDKPPQTHYLSQDQAATSFPTPEPTPPPRYLGVAQAAPKYALSAGVGVTARSLTPDGPHPKPANTGAGPKGVIVLDPGHGRGDPGAVHHIPGGTWQWDVTEAESNLRNAELIRDRLLTMGYEVYLTRQGAGDGPGGPLPLQFIVNDLFARVQLAKSVNADLFLAIHGNGATVHSISGPETWYCGKHREGASNERLARMVQRAMMDALHEYGYFPPDRGIKEDAQTHHSGDFCQFVVTRENPVPSALLEFLFLTNDDDAKVLLDDRAHVLLADHVAAAIDAFMRTR